MHFSRSIRHGAAVGIGVGLCVTLGLPALAGEIRDTGDAGSFFIDTNDNMAIYNSFFEVQFASYDGDGGTDESEKSVASVTYRASLPGTGVPAGEVFVGLDLQLTTWNGRDEFDGQTLADIYFAEISDNGVDFTPLDLTFNGLFPDSASGFTANTASASGFEAEYVKITIQARTESAGSGFNDAWASHIEEIYLLTALPGTTGGLAGDFNGNNAVEQADLDLVLGNWGSASKPASFVGNTAGLSDAVDQDELDAVLGNWGSATASPILGPVSVPEPAALGLSLAGLALMARRVRGTA